MTHPSPSDGGWRSRVAGAAAAAALYAALVITGAAAGAGFELRYDSVVLPVALAGAFVVLSRLREAWWAPALMLLSAGLCGAVLSGVWTSGLSDQAMLGGLLPHSDSFSYIGGSLRLVHDGELPAVAARRPLAPALGAGLFLLCGDHLRFVLALTVLLVALSLAYPVREVIRTHGWAAGWVLFLGLILFYRRFIGTALTEHAGLALGCLAFARLWRAAHGGTPSTAAGGALLLALGLCARAGAFFALPALAVWAGRAWRGPRRFSGRAFAAVVAAVIAGFAVNAVVQRSTGAAEAAVGNFSYVLYGMVHGGDWSQVLKDHPEVRALPEIERNRTIYGHVRQRLADQPFSLVAGAVRAVGAMVATADGPYGFVRFALQRSIRDVPAARPTELPGLVQALTTRPWKVLQISATYASLAAFSLLAVAGLVFLLRDRGPASPLLLWTTAGIVASTPFAPPWDADLMRVYAATMPFMLALPAVGLAAVAAVVRRLPAMAPVPAPAPLRTGLDPFVVLVPVVCLLTCLFGLRPPAPSAVGPSGAPGLRTLRLVPGSQILLGDEDEAVLRGVLPVDTVRRRMGVLAASRPGRAAELREALETGDTLAMAYDVDAATVRHVVLDAAMASAMGASAVSVETVPVHPGSESMWWRLRAPPVHATPADAGKGTPDPT